MYEPPLLDFYDNAILNNGDPRSYTVQLAGTSAGAPAFPAASPTRRAGFVLPRQSITAVDPEFRTQSAWLTNVQLERAIRTDMSVAVGYVNSAGRNLPVLMDVNLIPTGQALADGRPIFSTAVSAATRVEPDVRPRQRVQVDWRGEVQRVHGDVHQADDARLAGAGDLHAGAGATDNAPLTGTYVVGSGDDRVSDPANLDREKGVTPFNQTHTLRGVDGRRAEVSRRRVRRAGLNNNQLGLILQANSGLPFNIRSRTDLNQDGVTNDRPDGIERNAGRLGRVVYLDLRYSRFVPFSDAQRLELFFEAKNLFNTQNVSAVTRDVTTDAAGILAAPLPSPFPPQAPTTRGRCSWGLSSLSDAVMSTSNSQLPTPKALPTPNRPIGDLVWALVWELAVGSRLGSWELEVGI